MKLHMRAMTWLEIVVVICIIGLLIAILLPAISPHHPPGVAARVICSSNLRQIGQNLAVYSSENSGLFPAQLSTPDGDIKNFRNPTSSKPSIFSTVLSSPSASSANNKKMLLCPASTPWTTSPDLIPTATSNTSYLFNGVAVGTSVSKIPRPADFILTHENRYQSNASSLRPYATPAGNFVYWSRHDPANDAISQFSSNHLITGKTSGNALFADLHFETIKADNLQPVSFGLTPGGHTPGSPADFWSTATTNFNASSKTYDAVLRP